eukprot:Skav218723  [mRNA]  locus=scaffold1346:756676:762863:+ [translate_table: standard]
MANRCCTRHQVLPRCFGCQGHVGRWHRGRLGSHEDHLGGSAGQEEAGIRLVQVLRLCGALSFNQPSDQPRPWMAMGPPAPSPGHPWLRRLPKVFTSWRQFMGLTEPEKAKLEQGVLAQNDPWTTVWPCWVLRWQMGSVHLFIKIYGVSYSFMLTFGAFALADYNIYGVGMMEVGTFYALCKIYLRPAGEELEEWNPSVLVPPGLVLKMLSTVPAAIGSGPSTVQQLSATGAPESICEALVSAVGLDKDRISTSLGPGSAQVFAIVRALLVDPDVLCAFRPLSLVPLDIKPQLARLLRLWQFGTWDVSTWKQNVDVDN